MWSEVSAGLHGGGRVHEQLSGNYKTNLGVINFTPGHYKVTIDGNLITKGSDTVSGNKITFMDTGGQGQCPSKGKYKFKRNGKKLTFTKISDSGSSGWTGRADVLTHGAFTKVR